MLHLEIMKARPEVQSVVHCHPPHATAFAIAREPIPQAVLPEVEVFLGEVPIAPYETPGGKKFAETILPFVKQSNVIILANHGTVSFGESEEEVLGELETEFFAAETDPDDDLLRQAVTAILRSLEGETTILALPFDLRASAFQMRVWS